MIYLAIPYFLFVYSPAAVKTDPSGTGTATTTASKRTAWPARRSGCCRRRGCSGTGTRSLVVDLSRRPDAWTEQGGEEEGMASPNPFAVQLGRL
jgi:hypothetical protein